MHVLRRFAPAVLIVCALLPFTWLAFTNRDLPQFGKYQDDGLFLIAGKSLHDSQGYRISSLPGKPFQTKYQPVYPLLLSAVWALDGNFPQNLMVAAVVEWAIVVGFLLLSFALMRTFGFAPWKCALMTAYLALNPWLLYWGLLPISDFLFAALAFAAFWLFQRGGAQSNWRWTAGLIGAVACLTKVAGILIVPAICLGCWAAKTPAGDSRTKWKQVIVTSAPMLAAFFGWTVWTQLHRSNLEHSVMWYYTDYLAFHVKNGGLSALPQIVTANLLSFILTAGNSVLHNLGDSIAGRFLSVVICAGAISGTIRLIRRTKTIAYPAFCALLLLLLLVWNFSPNARLAAPLMPLLAMGLWEETMHVAGLIRRASASHKASDRALARLIHAGALAGIVCAALLNVAFIVQGLPQLIQMDRVAMARDRSWLNWCRIHLPSSSVMLANNDTLVYLATGLHAVRAVPNSIAFYRNDQAGELETFTHIDDFEQKFGVTHIVVTPEDFGDFEPQQRREISSALLDNPRHRPIYSDSGVTVLEIVRPPLSSVRP